MRMNCPFCPTTHATKSHLAIPVESKHENKKYSCNKCDSILSSEKSLKSHIKNAHSDKKNTALQCHLCEKIFVTENGLKKHVVAIHDGKKYPCEFCPFETSHPSSLHVHTKNMHIS